MKPSERRALKAQREEQLAEERATKYTQTQKSEQPQKEKIKPKKAVEKADEKTGGYVRKEGFFQSHVRLITFIITVTVVVCVFSPFGIDMLISNMKNDGETDKTDISMDAVYYISDNPGDISWSSFENFNYTDYSRDDGKYFVREYPIKGSSLVLRVGGANLGKAPDYVYLISYEKGEHVNILKKDAREFVEKYGKD